MGDGRLYTREQKLKAIINYLNVGWDKEAPMEYRVGYMLKEANRYANGHPEWSDIYGTDLKPIDDVNKKVLEELIKEALAK